MRILIVGAGATGGYFGGRLAQAGRDVTFLVRPARAAQMRVDGLRIVSPHHGDATLHPPLLTAPEIAAPFDAILLTVKAFALDQAIADMTPAVGPETMILPVLNGMRHVDTLIARFGAHAVAGCAAKVATVIDDQGRIVQLAPMQEIAYGEMDGTHSARADRLDAALRGAGFDARLSPVIALEMWEKWILLAAIGGINSLMRGDVGAIARAPRGIAFIQAFLDEAIAIVTAEGHPPSDAFVNNTRALLTQPAATLTSSMYRDLVAGRPIEADQIVGDLLTRADRHGLAAPLLAAAFTNLSIYQERLTAG